MIFVCDEYCDEIVCGSRKLVNLNPCYRIRHHLRAHSKRAGRELKNCSELASLLFTNRGASIWHVVPLYCIVLYCIDNSDSIRHFKPSDLVQRRRGDDRWRLLFSPT